MAARRIGIDVLTKSILLIAALALVGGLVWVVAIRDRITAPSPAAISLDDNRGLSPLAKLGSAPGKTFAVVGDDYALGDGAGWARGWVLNLSSQMCWGLATTSMQPGTGFVAALQPGVSAYAQRLDSLDFSGANYILVEGGANDFLATAEDITAAAEQTRSLSQRQSRSAV